MFNLTTRLCWKFLKRDGCVAFAIWQKPFDNSCYLNREEETKPPLCDPSEDPGNIWYSVLSFPINFTQSPRHPEMRKGVVSDEMLRGVENKHGSEDSRISQPFEMLLNSRAGKRQPGELKHLSSQRNRKQYVNLPGLILNAKLTS